MEVQPGYIILTDELKNSFSNSMILMPLKLPFVLILRFYGSQ